MHVADKFGLQMPGAFRVSASAKPGSDNNDNGSVG